MIKKNIIALTIILHASLCTSWKEKRPPKIELPAPDTCDQERLEIIMRKEMSQQRKENDLKLRQEMLEYLKNQREQLEEQMETLEIDTPPYTLEDAQSVS